MPPRLSAALACLLALCGTGAVRAQDEGTLALSCPVCHAPAAEAPRIPPYDGLDAATLEARLRAYRDGTLAGSSMPRLTKALSDSELQQLARRYGRPDS